MKLGRRWSPNAGVFLPGLFMIVLVTLGMGCGKKGGTRPNEGPQILWVRASPDTVAPEGTSALSAAAEDPEGDALSYEWRSRDGIFPQSAYGSQVQWKAPSERGRYRVTLVVRDGSNSTGGAVDLWVRENVPVLALEPEVLSFGGEDQSLVLEISNAGRDTLTWSVTPESLWVDVSPAAGISAGAAVPITVSVDRTGLASGYRRTRLTVESNAGSTEVPVVVWVLAQAALRVSPEVLDFGSQLTSANLTVANVGIGNLSWQAHAADPDTSWVSLAPMEGLLGPGGSDEIEVTISRAGAPPGERVGALWVESDGGGATVAVRAVTAAPSTP